MDEIIKSDNKYVTSFFDSLNMLEFAVQKLVKNCRPPLNGERYLTDKEVSELLKISRRTLQDYRTEGVIKYYSMGGKILYRESDIQELLESNYHNNNQKIS